MKDLTEDATVVEFDPLLKEPVTIEDIDGEIAKGRIFFLAAWSTRKIGSMACRKSFIWSIC